MNWALVASCIIALPVVCLFPEKYRRTDIDLNFQVEVTIDRHVEKAYISQEKSDAGDSNCLNSQ